ncbi:hypothetical protein CPB85DRAFT_1362405 [Mucidula mucida]|nr:hypothetical protein CPB85DRAFT_1362405 [Mucidula mucida]
MSRRVGLVGDSIQTSFAPPKPTSKSQIQSSQKNTPSAHPFDRPQRVPPAYSKEHCRTRRHQCTARKGTRPPT